MVLPWHSRVELEERVRKQRERVKCVYDGKRCSRRQMHSVTGKDAVAAESAELALASIAHVLKCVLHHWLTSTNMVETHRQRNMHGACLSRCLRIVRQKKFGQNGMHGNPAPRSSAPRCTRSGADSAPSSHTTVGQVCYRAQMLNSVVCRGSLQTGRRGFAT
jgi:hypothetical protein